MGNLSFAELGLSPEVLKAVEGLGFEQASPIQALAIPVLLRGGDVVGQSQTGSGKTAAFGIPAIEAVDPTDRAVQVLILCPTRELATQVADEIHKLAAFKKGLNSVPIYGGASYDRQFYELKKGVQIVIGTPGRVIDHLDRGTLQLDALKMVILDEADRMLDMGFREDIERILDSTPNERQTVFFSATVSKSIRDLINRYSRDPESLRIEPKEVSAPAIEQWFYEVPSRAKLEALIRLIDFHGFKLGIVFCNTQRMVDELADSLAAQGIAADKLHGGIAQGQRTRVMNKFKNSEFEFLVATDVAARGIDVDDLELVVNYDLPYDAEDYVHRIGRTGRAGRRGMAVTFVTGRDVSKLQFIEKFTRTKIRRGTLPTVSEIEERRLDQLLEKIRAAHEEGSWKSSVTAVEGLLEEGINSSELTTVLFHLLATGQDTGVVGKSAELDSPPPPPRESRNKPSDRETRPPREGRPPREEKGPMGRANDSLKRPAPGKAWVAVEAGRTDKFGPRDFVDLFSEGAGMDGRDVGAIQIGAEVTFVEVPEKFAKSLSKEGNSVAFGGGEYLVRPVTETHSSHAPRKPRDFPSKKPFSGGKPHRKKRF